MNNARARNEFDVIYQAESDSIFRFCFVRLHDRELALDLTQETFTRFWQSLLEGKQMTNARAFLFTVAHRLIIDWYRRKKPLALDSFVDPETGETYDPPDPDSAERIVAASEGALLLQALERVGKNNRQAIYLRYVEGLSPPEIGKVLGITANAVSVRLTRGIAELRTIAGYDLDENEHSKRHET